MSHSPTFATPIYPFSADPVVGDAVLSVPESDRSDAVSQLVDVCERILDLEARAGGHPLHLLHSTAGALHAFATSISMCEQAGLTRDELLPYLDDVRTLHAESPLVDRLQRWPRGYAGDFETVEWLCDASNHAAFGGIGWAIEECALQSPIAQQHRNKVDLQARAILTTLVQNPAARILSIGCGGCRDLSLIQAAIPAQSGTFVLVDADADALVFARARLDRLAGRVQCVQGRVPRVLSKLRAEGRFDLVIAGGLFDYLPDSWAVATLAAARPLLAPGGRLFFSNIATNNPFRQWIEYLADWRLIERTPADLRQLLSASAFDADGAAICRDTTGLALLVNTARSIGAADPAA